MAEIKFGDVWNARQALLAKTDYFPVIFHLKLSSSAHVDQLQVASFRSLHPSEGSNNAL